MAMQTFKFPPMKRVFDVDDFKALPGEFKACFSKENMRATGYPLWDFKGDTSAFFALFFDNLATQLSLIGMAVGFGFSREFIMKNFMGGVGISLFFGNAYYALQASKVAVKTGKMDTCAQPYGINTPGAIAKTFGVLMPAYFAAVADHPFDHDKALETAWSIACAANFLGGFFELLGSFIAPLIRKNVPTGAALAPIGAVGITWLGLAPLVTIIHPHVTHHPMTGFIPLIIMWCCFFGGLKLGPIPPAGLAGLVGAVLGWLVRLNDLEPAGDALSDSFDDMGANGLAWSGCLGDLGTAMGDYGSLVLGLACTNFLGTYACVMSAKQKGDVYSPMESMIVDGIGSMLGALFGSPYGTTVYIGHVAYKRMGAKRGYSLLNGVVFLIFGLFGLHSFIDALVPHEAILGVILVIGFTMATQVMEQVPKRWFPAALLGMMIGVADYAVAGLGSPNNDITFLQHGYIFISFLFTFVFMMLTDRWFLAAAAIFSIMVPLAFIGFIHASVLNFKYTDDGTIVGNEGQGGIGEDAKGQPGWKNWLTYAVSAGLCLVLHMLQKRGYVDAPEEEDFRKIQEEEDKNPTPVHSEKGGGAEITTV